MESRTTDPFPSSVPPPPVPRSASLPPGLAAGMMVGGKYELVRKIGTGAMGEVWAARHHTLDEEVAIKLVMRNVEHEDGTSAESRFLLEARVAAALSRKTRHIVAVTDHGQEGALGYLVMELLEGESLDARIARTGPLPVARVTAMITQIARGLSIAHGEGVVHRDLKPSNVFVTLDEDNVAVAKVLDFGIAKLRRRSQRKDAHATQRGFLLGTPAYMSPEQARGKPIDHRADVWALAVIAYQMLTGEFPFDGESAEELFTRLARIEPIAIRDRRPDLPPVVGDFFERAFSMRIEDRFQSALALAGAFEMLEPLAAGAKLSLPPPPALSSIDAHFSVAGLDAPRGKKMRGDEATLLEHSIFADGVPRKKKVFRPLLAGLLVGVVLASTAGLLSVYFEREPARMATGLTAGPTTADPRAAAPAIPAPEEGSAENAGGPAVVSTDDLPSAAVTVRRAMRTGARVSASNGGSDNPSGMSPAPAAAPTAPVAKGPRAVDKSEVF